MRKILVIPLLMILVMTSSLDISYAETDWQCPDGYEGQTLRIFSWASYVAETTIPDFEAACGATVEYFEYSSSDAMLSILQTDTAQYDLVIGAGSMAIVLHEQELVQDLDYSLLPTFEHVTLNPLILFAGIPLEYLMTYQSATLGIAYDVNVVEEPITSWAAFFAYEGRVAWIDDARYMLNIAGQILENPVATPDEAHLQAAADYLLNESQNDVFSISANTQTDLLLQGEVDAIIDTSRNVVALMRDCACEDFAFVLAEDGFLLDYDALFIPSNSENPDLTHAFIDYTLEPQVSADISSALGTNSPVMDAHALVDEEILNNGISYIPPETLMTFLSDMVSLDNLGVGLPLYIATWTDIKAELTSQ